MRKIIEFEEFTWDMTKALPQAYYCYVNKIPYQVICKPGLSDVYYFVEDIIETEAPIQPSDFYTYSNDAPYYTQYEWTPPPLKNEFSNKIKFDKPTVVIQNKYSLEWFEQPSNYFSIDFLKKIFKILENKYQIIYIRPRGSEKKYFVDDNEILDFNDYDFIKENFPSIYTIEDALRENPEMSYNQAQFSLEATSDKHLAVAGGNACVSAYFGGELIIFDSPDARESGRGIWQSNSWLSELGDSNVIGFDSYNKIYNHIKKNWVKK